jgi:drug/metabolite transporter (DMT)-like permease
MERKVLKSKRNLVVLVAAFAAVYVCWGSTYLAIRYAIETMPSFMMAGARFFVAGWILLIWARLSPDYDRPKLVHWRTSFIVGTLLLLIGNGGVVFAERLIPSSLAALLVATEPFWIVLLSWLWLGRGRPNLRVVFGLVMGFVGVALLIAGHNSAASSGGGFKSGQIIGAIAVIVSGMSWAAGSIYGLRAPTPKSAILTAGMQMVSGGTVLFVVSLILGEWRTFNIGAVSANSWFGLAYLTLFGSLIAFTAYSWLLKNARPAMVSTYAYVNPVIAVFLGWLIAGESFTGQMLIGAGVIVGSVVLITSQNEDKRSCDEIEVHDSITPEGCCKPLSVSA